MKKQTLIAAAWPYANGSLHLGHVAALLGADIIARYQRLCGNEVLFVSGSDCHGTPIAVEADRLRIHPSEIAERYHAEFKRNLVDDLKFSYDLYTTTTTDNHRQVVQELFLKLYGDGNIYAKTEELPYCAFDKRFLPDRYIEGQCPICHFDNARGDQCDSCGNLLDAKQLIHPRCKLCGKTPEWRPSEHFYLRLSAFQEQLKEWVKKSEGWRVNAKRFTSSLLERGLHDRAITRDTDWGIPIPLPGYEGKSIYVWFEAVCGYLSASKEWARLQGKPDLWQKFWTSKSPVHYYVHGKDNIPFHTIIWPTILLGEGGLHLPDRIVSSEYLTLEKRQFSKSRHWFVSVDDFLREFNPETLRYYLTANGPETSDADFSWENYRNRTNGELIGTFGNFVHRVLSLVKVHFPEGVELPNEPNELQAKLLEAAEGSFALVGTAIEDGRFREGLQEVIQLAERGNRYLSKAVPWAVIKQDRNQAETDLAVATHTIYCLAILIAPFLPTTADHISRSLGLGNKELFWQYPQRRHLVVHDLHPLYRKIEKSDIERAVSKLKQESG